MPGRGTDFDRRWLIAELCGGVSVECLRKLQFNPIVLSIGRVSCRTNRAKTVDNWARADIGEPKGFGYSSKSLILHYVRGMFSDTAERLKEFCSESIGDDLRAVIEYTDEGIQAIYYRDDVNLAVEDMSLDVLYNPILGLQRGGWRLTKMFEHFGPPTASLQAYDDKLLFTFPVDETTGIFVSVDRTESYITVLFPDLETLVHESEGGER